ncbi:stalk domain-containing protein [Paenibacillus sp. LHD-117]|uniref:stalk domain-containing protein n=1 Tax=Paenibacillus sp. LHD-117 TaxID=3071412 RepID=UPI0027DEDA36|nr:stalk domain-containing protein [Paenibacillus sp. LHD-117]MDQ6419927.1 stalk domain-containing protein [Paenibacillus sp. LHD-117]
MKKKLLITLAAGALMLTSAAAGAYGATNLQAIKANLNLGLKFKVDGKDWTPKDASGKNVYAITYNGTTYLPIRTAGDALGVEVGWDGKNNTVWLGEGASAVEAGQKPTEAVGFSRKNPAPLNTKVKFDYDEFSGKYTAEATITESIRGEEAWEMVYDANMFNEAPPEGYEYLLVKINFKVLKNIIEDKAVQVSYYDFDLVSSSGKDYAKESIVTPEPEFNVSLYEGASDEGWAAYLVEKGDTPVLAFGRDYDGTGGIWFKVQ